MSFSLWRIAPALALFALRCAAAATAAQSNPAEPQSTIITSDGPLTMQNDGVQAHFVFTQNVHLTGTNLEVTCDQLEVFAEQRGETGSAVDRLGSIRLIVASGNVVISQAGRRATAGHVEVLPPEDKIVLTGDPVVTDTQGTAAGEKITFHRGKQEFEIEKPRLSMRALPNLGFPQQTPSPAETPPAGAAPAPAPES